MRGIGHFGRRLAKRALAALALALASVLCASANAALVVPGYASTEIAHFNGSVAISSATYSNGLGVFSDANYAAKASDFDSLGSSFTIGVVMGSFTDYFRPASAAYKLSDMLTSSSKHSWSSSVGGTFAAPSYSISNLGGSAAFWPADGRYSLPFWGATGAGLSGGCCQAAVGGSLAWGQPFSMYLLTPVPEPHEWAMMLAGLGMVGFIARRRRAM